VHTDNVVQTLQAVGLGHNDRIALVLPNGPEMAVAFLAVAACATCVPLNPAYRVNEFDSYLTGLHAKALIVQAGMNSPARAVAHARGLRIIELSPVLTAEAGIFTLTGDPLSYVRQPKCVQADDVALMMHTSGTTAWPRRVPLTHATVCAAAHAIGAALALVESDRLLSVLPLFHSHGLISTLLASLLAGASVVCTPNFDAARFFAWMAEFHPTWYSAVPTIHQAILARAALNRDIIARCPLRFIRSSSAALAPQVLAQLERVFDAPVIEIYGMTEASTITCNPLPPRRRKSGSVGVAVSSEVAIMGEGGTLLPAGETGEIVVRGVSVMQGYDNDPLATRNAFTQGWLRTGDQGFLDTEGYLFITGRLKEIINRGGEKIAPQEVEAVLMDHPAVAEAVAFAVPDARLAEEIAAAVVLRQGASATARDIRQFAATRLADFKVPHQVLIVEEIPKGPTGKLQRIGLAEKLWLAAPEQAQPVTPIGFVAPRTSVEKLLAGVWAQVLDLARVGIHDDFFQVGGDSLLATQLLSRVRDVMHVDVPWLTFFETPTVAGIAKSIATVSQAELGLPTLGSVPRDGALPLSYGQQRLWFLEQVGLSRHAYTLLNAMHLRGPLSVTALEQSLQELIRRHEALRTTFVEVEGQPRQVIGPAVPLSLPVVELQAGSEYEWEGQVRALAQAEAERPFDLAQGPLLRITLVRLAAQEHVLILVMHHIVFDWWSHDVFWRELALLYEACVTGRPSPLPELSIQYVDFAVWQRQWCQGERLKPHLAYWKKRLDGYPVLLELPTDYPRPPVQTSRGARQSLLLPAHLTAALKALSRQEGGTLFITLLAAVKTLLYRYTGQEDMLVGSPIVDRSRAEIEGLVGFFLNTLVLRTDLSGAPTFRQLLSRVREVCIGAYAHQVLPFEKLVEELRPVRRLAYAPLFQVMFTFRKTLEALPALPGVRMRSIPVENSTAKFDLSLAMQEEAGSLRATLEYNTDLFADTTMVRMLGHLQTLLEGLVTDANQSIATLPLLTAAERHQVLVAWNATQTAYSREVCLHELFEAQVERTPDAVAVVFADQQLTYQELNGRANQLAHFLRTLGVGPEVLVGIYLERSLEMVVGLLGVLKAGGAYVPLDPASPHGRLAFMLEDSQTLVLLTQQRLTVGLPTPRARVVCVDTDWATIAQMSEVNPCSRATADNLAYVIYTSGTTGHPKGVMIPHRAICHFLLQMQTIFPLTAIDRFLQRTPYIFDGSVWEFFSPLVVGARLIMANLETNWDSAHLVQLIAEQQVTTLKLVPSLLQMLLETEGFAACHSLHRVFCGGEILPGALQERFFACLAAELYNFYGPTEATIAATYWACERTMRRTAPIGRPMADTQIYLLDTHLQPVPIGVSGEIHIGGAGLARGYLNRPELTADRFIPDPFSAEPGARLYKTGDLARYLPDGNLEFLGRLDHQVNLRGFRIELGEIEKALEDHRAIRHAVVVAKEDTPGDTRLVAYVVVDRQAVPTSHEPVPTISALRSFLQTKLPDYMVPSAFVWLDALPLMPNGKINRRALPIPDPARPELDEAFVAPCTPTEEMLAGLWANVLGVEAIGVHDNFFDLGGHSLLAVQVISRLRDALQVEVPLRALFEAPTVAGLALYIETAQQAMQHVPVPPLRPVSRESALPASVAQEQLWVLAQVLPSIPLFNTLHALRLLGSLNVVILKQSVNEIIRRHDALRTTFDVINGQLVQVIAPTLHVTLTVEDLRELPETERESEVQRLARVEAQQPFDLARGPLLRLRSLRLGEQEHILFLALHHIISDGWSLGVLAHELAVLYDAFAAGGPSPLPALPIQYADFAAWQRQWQHSEARQVQLAYWQQQLRSLLPELALPTDRPRAAALSFHTARQSLVIPGALSAALTRLSRQESNTLFMTLLTAFKVLLYSYTGQEDLRVGTLVANRNRQETEGLIGLFINTVILRTHLDGNPTLREVLRRVRATTLAAHTRQDLPFGELVQTLKHEYGLEPTSLCQVMFVLQNATQRPLPLPARRLSFLEADQYVVAPEVTATMFDLIMVLRVRPQGLTGSCIYKTSLFDAATIDQMAKDFQRVLARMTAQPEQLLSTFASLRDEHG
jgi:amino acid adenylation domain-containing protein